LAKEGVGLIENIKKTFNSACSCNHYGGWCIGQLTAEPQLLKWYRIS